MDRFEKTAAMNQEALEQELRKRDDAAIRWKTARVRVYRLLQQDQPHLGELIAAETEAERCAEELRVQQVFVRWCREWVESEITAMVAPALEIDQLQSGSISETSTTHGFRAQRGSQATETTACPAPSRDRPQEF